METGSEEKLGEVKERKVGGEERREGVKGGKGGGG